MSNVDSHTDFRSFIGNFKNTLKKVFHEQGDIGEMSLERGLPESVREEIMSNNPLSVAIPEAYGGRGCHVDECLGLLSASSYESLSLSLTFGINIALFLEPVAKYAQEDIKQSIFDDFLKRQAMGGLMITEPDYGSDALNMKTFNKELAESYQIQGTKHWQGLTGLADYWIIATRKKLDSGELARDIDFFISNNRIKEQHITVDEYFDNLGLYMIPYGRNNLDIEVPKSSKLSGKSTGIKMMLDILHRSRLQFPGMGMGFIHRMLDEALTHCKNRIVGVGNLLSIDSVQHQLSRIQMAYTLCSGMCVKSTEVSGIEHELATVGFEANSMKALVTDLMSEAANTLVQVSGANGYRISHIGGRGIADSRPFQIFEGSNEMLYSQVADTCIRHMKKKQQTKFLDFLTENPLTQQAHEYYKKALNFALDLTMPQRKMVDLGKILARLVCLGYVLEMGIKGFRKDLIDNCITGVGQDIELLVNSLNYKNAVQVIPEYRENSSWYNLVQANKS